MKISSFLHNQLLRNEDNMKTKIRKRLMGMATVAIILTLLLTVAICYNVFKNQVMNLNRHLDSPS